MVNLLPPVTLQEEARGKGDMGFLLSGGGVIVTTTETVGVTWRDHVSLDTMKKPRELGGTILLWRSVQGRPTGG